MEKADILSTIRNEGFEPHQKGRSFWLNCPLHEDKEPSFKIDPVRQSFHCFGCNQGGDAIAFVMKLHNLSFKEALHHLGMGRQMRQAVRPEEVTKRDLLRKFRQWERDYYQELCAAYRDFHNITKDFKTIEEVEFFAEDFDLMPVIEWHMDILTNGTDEDKYALRQFMKGGENGQASEDNHADRNCKADTV